MRNRTPKKKNSVNSKEGRKLGTEKKQREQTENKQQDYRLEPNQTNNYININGLNIPIKSQRLSDPSLSHLKETHIKYKGTDKLKE